MTIKRGIHQLSDVFMAAVRVASITLLIITAGKSYEWKYSSFLSRPNCFYIAICYKTIQFVVLAVFT